MKTYGDVDSKFRFVILASKRAKELLRGAKSKIKSKSKNPIRIAQEEIAQNVIDYEIIQSKKEEDFESKEEALIGEELEKDIEESVEKEIENVDELEANEEEIEEIEEEEIEEKEEDLG